MNKRKKILIAVLIGSLTFSSSMYSVFADDLENELSTIQSQIDESRSTQASWQSIIEEVSTKLRAIQAELDSATQKLKDIEKQKNQINEQIKQTENEIQKAQNELVKRQNILNKRVRAIYMNGQLSYLEVIVGSKNFSDFANRVELLKRIIRADFNLIKDIQQQKAGIEAKKFELELKHNELEKLAQEAKKTTDDIAKKKSEQQDVLNEAKTHKDAAQQLENDLLARSEQVREMINERVRQRQTQSQQSGGSYTQGTGALSWPCNGPITSPFGYRVHPIFGTTIYHSGIDIGVDYGTPIHAADSGTVIYAGWIDGYGNTVIIDHGNNITTLYGHNSSLAVSDGQSVSKGTVIAYAGSTGNSTGPHCHFEVQVGGSAVDPMGYL
ncbi:murein hydrolase activator EnvC family protein [Dialister micraerophilus]|uniref:murein hydrolase activator EnvC family protein n=1 Tax=Dialister micraerophilus TaxID=309120 RepID=UPI0023EFF5A6|nr:M23 family metallopeptidase [Dialister micraerophilus]